MTRRLPWKREQGGPAPKPEGPGASPERPGPPANAPPSRARASPGLREPLRSPSTSPPPEPPPEQPMVPGDDRYRMVEDEFLHTAQRFTTHLHRAEYNRLKARAKSQHALTIRAIERPVVGPPTATARLRDAAEKRASRQRNLLRTPRRAPRPPDGGHAADDDNAPWVGTTLQGLMETPRGEARSASSCAPVLPTARAAADPRRPLSPPRRRSPGATVADQPRFLTDARDDVPRDRTRNSAQDRRGAPGLGEGALSCSDGGATDDDDDPFDIKRRKMRRERSRAQLRKNEDARDTRHVLPDTIPSFF